MSLEHVSFRSGDTHCAADLYLPEKMTALVPGIVMGHSMMMVKEALAPHAAYLVNAGFAVLGIDYRSIGSSGGEVRCQVFPERQVEDVRNAVSYLATRSQIDPNRIGAWGHSVGGGVAIMAGVLDRRIKCVACQNPSMLDAWTAFEKMRGRFGIAMVRQVAIRDWEQWFTTGKGIMAPGLGADDQKVSEYAAQAVELYPTFRNGGRPHTRVTSRH
ncbi:MAG: alpha/beta fold hydrolase [Deltaproteobacteria bacterium]|nr:alpha/beta fold hydrolase [Deltaproteobacteria bacterium]